MQAVSGWVLPILMGICGWLMLSGNRYSAFLRGAESGIRTAVSLLPTLILLLAAVRMLRASGVLGVLANLLSPVLTAIGLPPSMLPLILTRPLSGSASLAAYTELLQAEGADSFSALCATVMMGSSDTTVYILSVYFSSVGIRKTRYALPVALAVMLFGLFFSSFLCRVAFKSA